VRPEPEHLQEQWGVTFQDSYDGLDDLKVARIVLESGRQITLISHRGDVGQGILLVAQSEDMSDQSPDLLREFLDTFALDESEVTWLGTDNRRMEGTPMFHGN
jgi:hypothetical protein